MSVPPPSCTPKSTSTGSSISSVRSTTSVSKTTSRVRTDRSEASTAPNTLENTTDSAIEPDWSMHRTMSRSTWWVRRAKPTSRSGTTVRCSGW